MKNISLPYPHRFRTLENAMAFINSETPDMSLVIPPFISNGILTKLNPDYDSAPYEQHVLISPASLQKREGAAVNVRR